MAHSPLVRALLLVLSLAACGGTVIGTGGQGGGGGWQPCAGKACGDDCTPCDPADPACVLPGTPYRCDDAGVCGPGAVICAGCATDADCAFGQEWCVEHACVPCDNSGMLCDILCADGWTTYARNGCSPCACAPKNACTSDADCGADAWCYAGAFCWDWCPPGDPSCCYGNLCSYAGCTEPPPTGCNVRGCPEGQSCEPNFGCAPSSCDCFDMGWGCTEDCGGGVCVTPL